MLCTYVAAIKVAEKGHHVIFDQAVEVELVVSEPVLTAGEQFNTITSANILLVKWLNAQDLNKPMLELYFSNQAKCRGGDILEIMVKDNEAYITYAEPEGISYNEHSIW